MGKLDFFEGVFQGRKVRSKHQFKIAGSRKLKALFLPVPPIQPPPMRVVAAFRKAAKDALKEQIKQTEDDLAILKQRLLEMPD